jgi:hypothetical protein
MSEVSGFVPQGAMLSSWAASEWAGGVQIELLPELTTLAVRTAHSLYEITILNGTTGDVLVRGGRFFPERTPARLNGSSFGGSILKWRGIYPGMKLELVPQPAELQSETICDAATGRTEVRVGYPVIWSSLIQSVEYV